MANANRHGIFTRRNSSARQFRLWGLMLLSAILPLHLAHAQNLTVLHSFDGIPDGMNPYYGVIRDASGNLYGTTIGGGTAGQGTVFKIDSSGHETVLYSFANAGGDGIWPWAGLARDAAGNLYGSTTAGGNSENGILFEISPAGSETVLYRFGGGKDGDGVYAPLVLAQGYLFGTTQSGGYSGDKACSTGCGALFRLNIMTRKKIVLHTFAGPPHDGSDPGMIVRDAKGNIFGVTGNGGAACTATFGCGTLYKRDPTGHYKVLHSFPAYPSDGTYPTALVLDSSGNIYGAAGGGGSSCGNLGCGAIFKLDATGKESVIYSFTGGADGSGPNGGLLRDKAGNLYGTTSSGGSSSCNCGTVFKLSPAGALTVLHTFEGHDDGGDGSVPNPGLAMDPAGHLYGTTNLGGMAPGCPGGCGTVFELLP